MLGGDEVGRFPEGLRAFVHFHDLAAVADVGAWTAAAGYAGSPDCRRAARAMKAISSAASVRFISHSFGREDDHQAEKETAEKDKSSGRLHVPVP